MSDNLLRLEYIPLGQAVLWDENPKQHDIGALVESIWRYGFQDPPKYDGALGAIVYGNGRIIALQMGQQEGREPPMGIARVEGSDEWAIPVLFGNDQPSQEMAKALAIDHNNLTMLGGDLTAFDMARMWDEEAYVGLLKELAGGDALPVSVGGDDLDALLSPGIDYDELWEGMPEFEQENKGPAKTIKVHFVTLGDIAPFANLIGQLITEKTKYIWYPEVKKTDMKKYICKDES